MDAVTYPATQVVEFIREKWIPVRLPHDREPEATEFNVKWTPTLIVLDAEGGEHHRVVGFLPPEELVPTLMLGAAKGHFHRDELDAASSVLLDLLMDYPKSDAAPEAIYLRGVVRYKLVVVPTPLREAYEKLQADFPDSEWTKRAYPYRLL